MIFDIIILIHFVMWFTSSKQVIWGLFIEAHSLKIFNMKHIYVIFLHRLTSLQRDKIFRHRPWSFYQWDSGVVESRKYVSEMLSYGSLDLTSHGTLSVSLSLSFSQSIEVFTGEADWFTDQNLWISLFLDLLINGLYWFQMKDMHSSFELFCNIHG